MKSNGWFTNASYLYLQSFDDVTRSIRANTAALLKKVNTPIPRAIRPLSIANQYE